MDMFKRREVVSKGDISGFRFVVVKSKPFKNWDGVHRPYYYGYLFDVETGRGAIMDGLPLYIDTAKARVEADVKRWARAARKAWNNEAATHAA